MLVDYLLDIIYDIDTEGSKYKSEKQIRKAYDSVYYCYDVLDIKDSCMLLRELQLVRDKIFYK